MTANTMLALWLATHTWVGTPPPGQNDTTDDKRDDPINVEQISLDDLLNDSRGATGSIGRLLQRTVGDLPIEPFVHGYLTFDMTHHVGHDELTFDMHYFNMFFGADIANLVQPELQLSIEHGNEFAIRTGQVDLKLHQLAVIRAGLFLVPFGPLNESHYPELFAKLPRGPLVLTHRHVVPVVWNDVGVQIRGRVEPEKGWSFGYAAWVSNGLEQEDDAATPEVDQGGPIRSMRGNFQDEHNPDKAFGFRLWAELGGVVGVGVSAYHGAYTQDGKQRLTLLGADVDVHVGALTWRTEGAVALIGTTGETLTRWGVYSRAGYKFLDWFEPAVGVDLIDIDGAAGVDTWQIVAGLNFYPFPELAPQVVARAAYAYREVTEQGAARDHADQHVMLQLSLGF